MIRRRDCLALALPAVLASPVRASTWPARPIRIVVPYAPGGVTDLGVRIIARLVEADLGQPVTVENKPGANGTLGATQMIGTAPDGYVLSVVPVGIFRQPYIEKMALDPLKHLTYIASLIDYSYVIAIRNEPRWKSLPDFIEDARRSGGIMFGTPGIYSTPHLSMEEFGRAAGFQCTHVPYKSASETTTALLGRQVDLIVQSGGGSLDGFVEKGQLRLLATLGATRAPAYPAVPTLKEAGIPVVAAAPFGLVGPAGMDPQVVQTLDASVRKALANPELRDIVARNSAVVQYMGPADYLKYAQATAAVEKERMGALRRQAAPGQGG